MRSLFMLIVTMLSFGVVTPVVEAASDELSYRRGGAGVGRGRTTVRQTPRRDDRYERRDVREGERDVRRDRTPRDRGVRTLR